VSASVRVTVVVACATARRRSISARTSSRVGTSSPIVPVSWAIAAFICSCIFAWSSWFRSFSRFEAFAFS
jgi:hypothetical protein